MNSAGFFAQLPQYYNHQVNFPNTPVTSLQHLSPVNFVPGMSSFADPQMVANVGNPQYNVVSPLVPTGFVGNQQSAVWNEWNATPCGSPNGGVFTAEKRQCHILTPVNPSVAVGVYQMTVEQTATWVQMVGQNKGWEEAHQYS